MNLSKRWLHDYVNLDVTDKDFAAALTLSGSKVEGYETEGEELSNIVVAKIEKLEKHPDSDHLWICQVNVGAEENLQIVTGAQNLKEGDYVPAALDNSVVAGGKKIKKGKLRGVESAGMLCSLGELGLTVNDFPYAIEDGIFVLGEDCDLTLGMDIREATGFNDVVTEFEITSNRPDCLSVIGLARETAVTYGMDFVEPTPVVTPGEGDVNDLLKVKIEAPELCYRYVGAVVKNVKIEPSPRWMRERLRACGVRPINNIVDITNFVMLEYGQPMHAFDLRYLEGNQVIVRNAKAGEKITTLDGIERELSEEMLVIADENKPVAVAGVMGGEYSGIMDDTNTIVFESACFNGPSVRMTAKKLGMRTEASSRFDKQLDPKGCRTILDRALQLVQMLGAGEVINGAVDCDCSDKSDFTLPFEPEWVNGFNICSMSRYSSVENVNCINITGYGGCVGLGKEGPEPDGACPYKWLVGRHIELTCNAPFTQGALNPKTGEVDSSDKDQWASGLVGISSQVKWNYLQIGRFGGYQGTKMNGWCYAAAFYDSSTNFISGEIAHQFRHVLIPANAKFLRISVGATNAAHAADIGPVQTLKWPRNCSIERCRFDRCRAVGIAPNHMSNFLFAGNEVSHSGESLATCGFDAEDGWDSMQDVLLLNNYFHDNPNNEILTCAGMNFQFVGNRASIHLWPRTYSSYIASNDCVTLNVGVDSRIKTGYVRLEGNRVKNLVFGAQAQYRGWDLAICGKTFDAANPDSPKSIVGGPSGRFSNCTFRGIDARVSQCEKCLFENTFVSQGAVKPNGRWTDCVFKDSRFSTYLGEMLFVRTSFPGSFIGSNNCKMTFVDCDLAGNCFGADLFLRQTFINCKGMPKE